MKVIKIRCPICGDEAEEAGYGTKTMSVFEDDSWSKCSACGAAIEDA